MTPLGKLDTFTFEDTRPSITNDDVLCDLRRVAAQSRSGTVTVRSYATTGKYSSALVKSRFGSWNSALSAAGLRANHVRDVSDEELWDNVREVWIQLGQQPRRAQMRPPLSRLTNAPYVRRFGSWLNAMREFAAAHKGLTADGTQPHSLESKEAHTPRNPSLRLRFHVMKRDHFRCCSCGRSPATNPGLELHIDHVAPWSKGGRTLENNLQTLCNSCNLGKSDQS